MDHVLSKHTQIVREELKNQSASGMCRADGFCVWWNFYADQTTKHGSEWFEYTMRYFRFAFWEMQIKRKNELNLDKFVKYDICILIEHRKLLHCDWLRADNFCINFFFAL